MCGRVGVWTCGRVDVWICGRVLCGSACYVLSCHYKLSLEPPVDAIRVLFKCTPTDIAQSIITHVQEYAVVPSIRIHKPAR